MSSAGRGRLLRDNPDSMERWLTRTDGTGSGAAAAAYRTWWWGTTYPTVTIPYGWISPGLRFRADQPINEVTVSRPSGATAYSTNSSSIATYGDVTQSFTLETANDTDLESLAAFIVAYYAGYRMRCPSLTLNLMARTPDEARVILGVQIGTRIVVPDAPTAAVVSSWDFRSGVSGWSPNNGWTVTADAVGRLAAGSMRLTPPGGTNNGGATATKVTATAGTPYLLSGWFLSAAGWSDCRMAVDWHDPAGNYLTSTFPSPMTVPAGVWTQVASTVTAPAGAGLAAVRPYQGNTPSVTDVLNVDDILFAAVPQGTVGAWPEGTGTLVVEGISHQVSNNVRTVTLNTSPVIGGTPGVVGPWFRLNGGSVIDGTDPVPF